MDDDLKPRVPSGDMNAHTPLPYSVRLRVTLSDDAVPTTETRTVIAYSVMEAVLQVAMSLTGSAGGADQKVVVEHIEPDVPAYFAMVERGEVPAFKAAR